MTKEEATARVKADFEAGLKAFQAERYGEALESLNDALAIAPKFDSALVLRGVVLARLKKPKVALESLDEGIAVARENRGPDSDWLNWPYLEKGLILISMRQFKPGYEALSESIRVKPTPKALIARANMDFARGRALGDKGNWDAAEPYFRHAQADADKGIEMAPQSAPFWSIKAGTHIMLNEHEQACSAMRKACEFGNCSILEQNPQCKPGGS
jgi:tetratricopeptide (TPR) repeat protein